jgi:hypothetical protein
MRPLFRYPLPRLTVAGVPPEGLFERGAGLAKAGHGGFTSGNWILPGESLDLAADQISRFA